MDPITLKCFDRGDRRTEPSAADRIYRPVNRAGDLSPARLT